MEKIYKSKWNSLFWQGSTHHKFKKKNPQSGFNVSISIDSNTDRYQNCIEKDRIEVIIATDTHFWNHRDWNIHSASISMNGPLNYFEIWE